MHANLRQFIETLRREKQLVEIEAEVNPYLELAEIHRRIIEKEGPALLFKRVKGSPYPVVTNLFGTRKRVDMAVGTKPEEIVKRAVSALHRLLPPRPSTLWQEKDWILSLAKSGMRVIKANQAPVLEIKENSIDLTTLPVLTSWPEDGGPFVTLPLVYTEHPLTREHNLGMYRIQIYNSQQTGIHWQIQKGGGFHYHEAERLGQDLPTTLFLGGPPALILSAIAPLPEMLPELIFTSFLMGEKLTKAKIPNHPHSILSECEFAICGKVPANIRKPEGPFGDHYGYYSLTHDFPVFDVHTIYHRKDAIYPATVVGKPRQEDYFIGEYLQSLLSPMFPVVMPGVKALWTYAETGFHALAAAVVRESYHREALAHAFRILGEGQLTLTKFLILTDVQLNLQDFKNLLETVLARFEPQSDLLVLHETSMDTLDYTGRRLNHGSKAIMLGLGKPKRELPIQPPEASLSGVFRIRSFCAGCLLIEAPSFESSPQLAEDVLQQLQFGSFKEWPLVILVDDLNLASDSAGFLWQVFTRFDPAHDIYASTEIIKHRLVYRGPILIDARMKPGYPGEVLPDETTVKLVNRRWKEYGFY
ncbi:UbiD family decarboxylase [Desulfosporosinus orientis DSM 765]|uniref:UbiD family decarboxylase n=1 Tax=Desulfosporosinus orientis (strain ATCC 19365 / DSM 765 / NCIMB 8382 / VKM B-1628 / Singapore I) TaxID=768706 RepID=G7WBN0_DESOD|nr:UbiD family decarboxylase [Desulfosporosinus orientis]AET68788.1 UbiD family decarboxylase [Desulfosporosinus orientis DSM 765]